MEVMDEGKISWKKGIALVGRSVLITPTQTPCTEIVYKKGGNISPPGWSHV